MARRSFDDRIKWLDRSLFRGVPIRATTRDRQCLLALQRAIRERFHPYVYLEIGSDLGGSLHTHLRDPRCAKVYSVDSRPSSCPNERGAIEYFDNTTNRMTALLRLQYGEAVIEKLKTFDCDASEIPSDQIDPRPHLCYVDGQHTVDAAYSDGEFCRSVMVPNGILAFHDIDLIRPAVDRLRADYTHIYGDITGRQYSRRLYAMSLDASLLPDLAAS